MINRRTGLDVADVGAVVVANSLSSPEARVEWEITARRGGGSFSPSRAASDLGAASNSLDDRVAHAISDLQQVASDAEARKLGRLNVVVTDTRLFTPLDKALARLVPQPVSQVRYAASGLGAIEQTILIEPHFL